MPTNSKLQKKTKKKWDKIIDENGLDKGIANCAFCQTYYSVEDMSCSIKCPIFIFTGVPGCQETPYIEWVLHQENIHENHEFPNRVICSECLELAKKERKFLDELDEICNENTEHTVVEVKS